MAFVTTLRPRDAMAGNRYTPASISCVVTGMYAPIGYAPMSASSSTRIPTKVPSRIAPISTNCTCARPCVRFNMLSVRDSCQRIGRPTICAARPTARYSG